MLSLVHANYDLETDKFLTGIVEKIEIAKMLNESDFIEYWCPKGQAMSRNMVGIEKGQVAPPHLSV
ncbi:hypothetical protein [Candidatus Nitrospira neomarina]|uniref:Uncharacterized protein n=1 Tax=Candidatus Nitrospira neomarina TaxID=3020899 RepID=A0AA96GE87_9BACT|nr:hypothetical protein [Candidatus Nitrospira neomarina]WNM60549.1 hypothetical protein PQG83_12340 [Candidatus Nitrospira neomarina]